MGNSTIEIIGLWLVIFSCIIFLIALTTNTASNIEGRPVRLKRVKKTSKDGKLLSTSYSIEVRSSLGHWVEVERDDNLERINKNYEYLKRKVGIRKPKVNEDSEIISSSNKTNIKIKKL